MIGSTWINFVLEGEVIMSRRLQGISNIDLAKPFDRAAGRLVSFYEGDVFSSQGAAIGKPWVGGPRYHGLDVSGTMRGNFKKRVSSSRMEVYNPTPYFVYHQSNQPRKKLPRRQMIDLDEERRQWIVKEVQAEAIDILQRR